MINSKQAKSCRTIIERAGTSRQRWNESHAAEKSKAIVTTLHQGVAESQAELLDDGLPCLACPERTRANEQRDWGDRFAALHLAEAEAE
jgi:hypothetical protein